VAPTTPLQGPPSALSQSPLWTEILNRATSQISGDRRVRGSGPPSLAGMSSVLARAHSHFLLALNRGSNLDQDLISGVATEAVELLLAVAKVPGTFGVRAEDRRAWLADQLRRGLAALRTPCSRVRSRMASHLSMVSCRQPRWATRSPARPVIRPSRTAICCRFRSRPLTWRRCWSGSQPTPPAGDAQNRPPSRARRRWTRSSLRSRASWPLGPRRSSGPPASMETSSLTISRLVCGFALRKDCSRGRAPAHRPMSRSGAFA
jgi:hypothetical protein